MNLENRAEATAKNIEGKLQEVVGDITGDTKTQAEGKAKQVQASAQHAIENVKDAAKDIIDH